MKNIRPTQAKLLSNLLLDGIKLTADAAIHIEEAIVKSYNLGVEVAAQNANCFYNEKNMQWEVDDKTILKQKL